MDNRLTTFLIFLLAGFIFAGCSSKEAAGERQPAVSPGPARSEPSVSNDGPKDVPAFEISNVPVVNAPPGAFPYVGLIDGYIPKKSNFSKEAPFDKYEFFDGTRINTVEGKLVTIVAEGKGAAAHEIFETYESLITGLGGVKVYEGATPRHLKPRTPDYTDKRHRHSFSADRLAVYVLRTPESEVWVEAYVSPEGVYREGYFLTVVEKQSLQVRARLLPAAEMKKALDAEGHVALYINFDFNKADIKPESQPIINEVVKLLKENPGLKLTIEGHTDNIGSPDYNQRLSEARARAVVAAVTLLGVVPARLSAVGYGQEKPIADNDSDDGRAQNRRVELVKVG
jgi:OmpA-OmpF porin, OOP family